MQWARFHTLAWLVWLLAAASLALLNQQPLPQVLLCLALGAVFSTCAPPSEVRQGWAAFIRLGLFAWAVALCFNLLGVHSGRWVLFTLPREWPLVGGNITLEALLYGTASGLGLFAILLVFATFNAAVDVHRLLRWVPSGLLGAGLVVSIGITFVPYLVTSWQEIRDAQRVRGHRMRGVRALLPLFVPLLTAALERSFTLAESMEARGFGGTAPSEGRLRRGVGPAVTIVGFLAILAGLLVQSFLAAPFLLGWGLILGGVAVLTAAITWQGRQVRRGRYRQERWRAPDTLVAGASLASLGLLLALKALAPDALRYYPYPPHPLWPGFHPLAGLAAMFLSTPALPTLLGGRAGQEATR